MMRTERFVARVVNGGRITIEKDVRDELGIREGDYVQMTIWKLDLFSDSMHRFASSRSKEPLTKRQVSATRFTSQEKANR